jgi:hypothetical protein
MFLQNFFSWHCFGNLLCFSNSRHHSAILQTKQKFMPPKIRLLGGLIFSAKSALKKIQKLTLSTVCSRKSSLIIIKDKSWLVVINPLLNVFLDTVVMSSGALEVNETELSIFGKMKTLKIHQADETNMGKYRCRASNSMGTVDTQVQLYRKLLPLKFIRAR